LEETRALLLIERQQTESLQNNLQCSSSERWNSCCAILLPKQLSFTIAVDDSTHSFWTVCSYGDAFAFACVLASIYGFLQGAWPFGAVEAVWSVVALRRWWMARALQ
jgi:hypothetical protein